MTVVATFATSVQATGGGGARGGFEGRAWARVTTGCAWSRAAVRARCPSRAAARRAAARLGRRSLGAGHRATGPPGLPNRSLAAQQGLRAAGPPGEPWGSPGRCAADRQSRATAPRALAPPGPPAPAPRALAPPGHRATGSRATAPLGRAACRIEWARPNRWLVAPRSWPWLGCRGVGPARPTGLIEPLARRAARVAEPCCRAAAPLSHAAEQRGRRAAEPPSRVDAEPLGRAG